MLFEDLFSDVELTAPAPNISIQLNQNGRNIQMQAEFLEGGEVVRWNRVADIRRSSGTGRLGEKPAVVTASV
jgi:hypothetical protein